MWAAGRYTFGLSEEDFWEMSPGMWMALHEARHDGLKIYDAMQARISSMIASSIPRKNKKKIKEADFRLLKDGRSQSKVKQGGSMLLGKMQVFAAKLGIDVRRR